MENTKENTMEINDEIVKQARILEDYNGYESDIKCAEKSGKFHGFIAGANWAISTLEAENKELREMLQKVTDLLEAGFPNISAVKESKELLNKER